MIWNIIDRRKRPYRWRRINAAIEATSNDNSVGDSDQADLLDDDVLYDERRSIPLSRAVQWAMEHETPVTLYLYDEGDGL